jgi:hypothetical protein
MEREVSGDIHHVKDGRTDTLSERLVHLAESNPRALARVLARFAAGLTDAELHECGVLEPGEYLHREPPQTRVVRD